MTAPLISIIVPVYKTEKFLNKCIESITGQTYKNIEVLLVDDGSPDNCPEMCDTWAEKDERIKVIHKKNGGASDARNTGIKNAQGKYLIFIDSDDYWTENDFLQNAVDILAKTNDRVLLFGYKETTCKAEKHISNFSACDKENIISYDGDFCIKHNILTSAPWNKIIEREFVTENNIFFRLNVHSEDVEWTAKLIALNDSYSIYQSNVYAYYVNENSITQSITEKDVITLIDNIDRCLDLNNENQLSDSTAFFNYVAYQYITALNLYLLFAKTKQIKSRLKNYRYLLRYHSNKKVELVYLFNKFFGFTVMTQILYLFLKIRKTGR